MVKNNFFNPLLWYKTPLIIIMVRFLSAKVLLIFFFKEKPSFFYQSSSFFDDSISEKQKKFAFSFGFSLDLHYLCTQFQKLMH